MASSGPIDFALLLAALVEESETGVLTVSDEWFVSESKPFEGKQFSLKWLNGNIHISLEEV